MRTITFNVKRQISEEIRSSASTRSRKRNHVLLSAHELTTLLQLYVLSAAASSLSTSSEVSLHASLLDGLSELVSLGRFGGPYVTFLGC